MTGQERRIMKKDKITLSVEFYKGGEAISVSIPKEVHKLSAEVKSKILYCFAKSLLDNPDS